MCLFTPLSAQEIISDKVIWSGQTYAAFTSLVYYNGYYYCAFREANKHWDNTGKDCGIIRLVRTRNHKQWKLFKTFKKDGHDLRDPQLFITPDNVLIISAEDVVYRNKEAVYRNTVYSFKQGMKRMPELSDLNFTPDVKWNWLWQPEIVNNKVIGFLYCPYFAMAESDDGINFRVDSRIAGLPTPTEASVSYYQGNYVAIVRTSEESYLGKSKDLKEWDWNKLNKNIECPKLFVYDNNLYVVGRLRHLLNKSVTVLHLNLKDYNAKEVLTISKGSDNGYPGVVKRGDYIYVSYYDSGSGASNIHIANIKLK